MMPIDNLHDLLNWSLLKGGHKFPGPDGGTCINEAALVVAGFPYGMVQEAADLPACFSRPISIYALKINDAMPDDLRQELLMPFVVRLAGSADSHDVECQRAKLIALRTISNILPIVLRLRGFRALAEKCERVKTLVAANAAANAAAAAAATTAAAYAANAAAAAAYDATAYAANAAAAAYDAAAYAVNAAAAAYAVATAAADAAEAACATAYDATAYARREIWTEAAAILDAALRIGRQAEPIEVAVVLARAEQAKQRVAERVP